MIHFRVCEIVPLIRHCAWARLGIVQAHSSDLSDL